MRICIVAENHPLALMGGAEYQTHLLAEELARRKDAEVFYLARNTPAGKPALPYEIRSIANSGGFKRRAVFFDAPLLTRTLRELQPAVIYHQMKQSYSAVCSHYARREGIPFFLHMASEWDLDPSWFRFRFSANIPFDFVEAVTGNWGLRTASHLIAQTPLQDTKLRERFDRQAAMVVRNFQPLPQTIPERPAGPLRVLWVGNIKEVKRPELYVELASRFKDRSDLHFDMVGRPLVHESTVPLMKAIAELPNLTFHGELPIARVNEMMSAATLYVNTSSHEGFPNTYIQAWAHGAVLMTIAVDPCDGMDALGIGFCTGTLERMVELVRELASQPDRCRQIAQQGFQYAHANHALGEGARLADAMLDAAKSFATARNKRAAPTADATSGR
jgi:glycosyltransferase involved in cell wall biosynthesis